jgi:hypothetical protein
LELAGSVAAPAFFVGSLGTTADGLHECVELGGVNLEQPLADSYGIEVTGGYPTSDSAIVHVAALGRFGQANEFGVAAFTPIPGFLRHFGVSLLPSKKMENTSCAHSGLLRMLLDVLHAWEKPTISAGTPFTGLRAAHFGWLRPFGMRCHFGCRPVALG